MTLNDFEWPFYVKFPLIRIAIDYLLLIYCRVSLHLDLQFFTHVISGEVREAEYRTVIRRKFGIRGKTADLS